LAVGDFTGTGTLDLAVANFYSNNVSVLLGHGDGTFAAARNYAVGSNPLSVTVGDFTGTGILDLAVPNGSSNDVSILLGNGNGTFGTSHAFAAGSGAYAVAVGDFEDDGTADLAVADFAGDDVSLLLGHGDGTFQQAPSFAAGSNPAAVVVGDFNGDGIPDLAVANDQAAGTVSVLLGNGDGTFGAPRTYAVGRYPTAQAVADFTGDGHLDLVVANNGSNSVSVLLGNGDGTFQSALDSPAGTSPVAVAVGDFDGDGIPDLVVADAGTTAGTAGISVLLGNGDGTFRASSFIAASARPNGVAVGDITGTGTLDLVVTNLVSNSVSVLLGNGDGTFQAPVSYPVGEYPGSVVLADFTGTGTLDLAVANTDSPANETLSVLLGNGDGTFLPASKFAVGPEPLGLAVADFTGDGILDLAVVGGGGTRVLAGNGDGTFQTPDSSYVAGISPFGPTSVAAAGDFNRDGLPDLAVVGNQRIFILTNDGSWDGGRRVAGGGAGRQGHSMTEPVLLGSLVPEWAREGPGTAVTGLPWPTISPAGFGGEQGWTRSVPLASSPTDTPAVGLVSASDDWMAFWLTGTLFGALEASWVQDRLAAECIES
jgi:hypothetical protein